MNRNFGGSAGVIALIAFVVHMAIPSGPEGGHDSSAPIAAANGKGGKPKPKPKDEGQSRDTPPEREGPWLATQAFFHSLATPNTQELPDFDSASDIQKCSLDKTCAEALRGYFGIGGPKHIQFLLATVPDPLHTRLSLFTDTSIEAIQKAATDEDWQFATQWLPWSDEVDPDEGDPIVRTAQREFIRKRERQPGILVFRPKSLKSDAVLVVFLIGETPTEGVNPTEFQIARAYMRSVQDPEEPVRIQGPTFSGSLYSLKTLLEEDTKLKQSSYVVRSGTVTDDKTKEEFDKGSNFSSAASKMRPSLSRTRPPTAMRWHVTREGIIRCSGFPATSLTYGTPIARQHRKGGQMARQRRTWISRSRTAMLRRIAFRLFPRRKRRSARTASSTKLRGRSKESGSGSSGSMRPMCLICCFLREF